MRKELLDWIESVEGGYVNDPVDRGGETNMGITHYTLQNAYNKGLVTYTDVNKLTYDDAARIYEVMYYEEAKCPSMPRNLDWVHFDAAVNSGPGKAGQLLQLSINEFSMNKIEVDGAVGPNTLNTLAQVIGFIGTTAVINTYLMYRMIFYNQIVRNDGSQLRFLSGWLNRIIKLKKAIL